VSPKTLRALFEIRLRWSDEVPQEEPARCNHLARGCGPLVAQATGRKLEVVAERLVDEGREWIGALGGERRRRRQEGDAEGSGSQITLHDDHRKVF